MPTSSSRVDPATREGQVVDLLDSFPRELGPILIGGYAVAAYGPPRFSVDVDMVLPRGSLEGTHRWLKAEGAVSKETLRRQASGFQTSKLLVSRGLITGDLYFGGLHARDSGAFLEHALIADRPYLTRLTLTTGRTGHEFPVARAEILWVLKLMAGRPQDITDLFAIYPWKVDWGEIRSILRPLRDVHVNSWLEKIAKRVASDKEYRDALSRRSLGSPSDAENRRLWGKFKKDVTSLLGP